ncbi:hypothetical protein ACFL60_02045 [Candidatus Omnitrophota bacterium]
MTVAFDIGVVFALILPKINIAVATILPPQISNKSSMLSQLNQFAGSISGNAGINRIVEKVQSDAN